MPVNLRLVLTPSAVAVALLLCLAPPTALASPTTPVERRQAIPAIINGAVASNPGWVASIGRGDPSDGTYGHSCTGSLIAPDLILTAAHCFDGASCAYDNETETCGNSKFTSEFTVMIGGVNVTDPEQFEVRKVSDIFLHPSYVRAADQCPDGTKRFCSDVWPYDVSILRLEDDVTDVTTANYSCDPQLPRVGSNIITYGWGECRGANCNPPCLGPSSDDCNVRDEQTILQWTGPTGQPVTECSDDEPAADACTNSTVGVGAGDSGGPSVLPDGTQVTITSFGNGPSSDPDTPVQPEGAIFQDGLLRTGSVCDWIHTIDKNNSFIRPKCQQLGSLGNEYDVSQCGAGAAVGDTCTVTCSADTAVKATYTCTAASGLGQVPTWQGALPTCTPAPPAPGPDSTVCGTLDFGPTIDSSQCTAIPLGGYCTVRCAPGLTCSGPRTRRFQCVKTPQGDLVYVGDRPYCHGGHGEVASAGFHRHRPN